jgi:hypothetical protein
MHKLGAINKLYRPYSLDPLPQGMCRKHAPTSLPERSIFIVPLADGFKFKHFLHPMNCTVIQPIVSVTTTWVS